MHQRNAAEARRLIPEAESMMVGNHGGGDVRAFQEILAAYALAPDIAAGGLLAAVVQRRRTAKIVSTGAGLWSMAFSPDGHRVATAGFDNAVRLWNVDTGQPVGEPLTGHGDAVTDVAFSPDGHRLASASDDHTVRLWNAETGRPLATLIGHTEMVNAVAFSPDGHRLTSANYDNTVLLWNIDTGQTLGPPLTGHTGPVTTVASALTGTGWPAAALTRRCDYGTQIPASRSARR